VSEGAGVLCGILQVVGGLGQAGREGIVADQVALIVLIGLAVAVLVQEVVRVAGGVVDDTRSRPILGVFLDGCVELGAEVCDHGRHRLGGVLAAVVIFLRHADLQGIVHLVAAGAGVSFYRQRVGIVAVGALVEVVHVHVPPVVGLAGIFIHPLGIGAEQRGAGSQVVNIAEGDLRIGGILVGVSSQVVVDGDR